MTVASPNPLARPDVWSLSASTTTVDATMSWEEEHQEWLAIVNSARDPIVGLKKRQSEITMSVKGNRSGSPFLMATSLVNRVNNAAWANGAEAEWLCTGMSGSQKSEIVGDEIVDYWEVSFSFTFRPGGWYTYVPNVGLNELVTGPGGAVKKKIMLEDSDGNLSPASKPQPLNSDGSAKAAGQLADMLRQTFYLKSPFAELLGNPPI